MKKVAIQGIKGSYHHQVATEYFVNEIEYVPNLFPEYNTHVDILKKVGEAIIKKSKDLKKKNNIK